MRQLQCKDYTVGWVCALFVELQAAKAMLDEEDMTPREINGTNVYACGRVCEHNVVIACLPEGQTGTDSAAGVAAQMMLVFKSIQFGLMVGVGGGVPSEIADIRLGDVVVSRPLGVYGGVVQYDSGKATPSGFGRIGLLNSPPQILLNAVPHLRADSMIQCGRLKYLSRFARRPDVDHDAAGQDILFNAKYNHEGGNDRKGGAICDNCNPSEKVPRDEQRQEVMVHYGTIASGNQVMRDATQRDMVSKELGGVLCFEMEAAGLMNHFPCLVIRGICDYADSHKNKKWQPYAASTAAAYAKEVLSRIQPVTAEETTREASGTQITPNRNIRSRITQFYGSIDRRSDFSGSIQANSVHLTIGGNSTTKRRRDGDDDYDSAYRSKRARSSRRPSRDPGSQNSYGNDVDESDASSDDTSGSGYSSEDNSDDDEESYSSGESIGGDVWDGEEYFSESE
ncbi:nucleoside phosphorylase domain-containing protein [Paraphoma chrysanthemicola]|uniref:Nucleoside phosphorylase domain-containing protein n=1 Tax=Paraphoma chrysanthemicola TaxID=798071 RepID=A0A8K0RHB6_9PLEO|nr:nucleoside phosphorylase domain-containing protein [Paraphoma chrysanthemicola]